MCSTSGAGAAFTSGAGEAQLTAVTGVFFDDRSWRDMHRGSTISDRWCCVLDRSGVTDLRLLQLVGGPVEVHVDICHGHRGCPVTDGTFVLHGNAKTNLRLLQVVWNGLCAA